MAISNKMATSNKVRPVNNASLFRLFAWVTGHATVVSSSLTYFFHVDVI